MDSPAIIRQTDPVTQQPTNDWAALGAALRARREGALDMTRAQVEEAGGPSPATIQRIENGEIRRDIKPATKRGYERALQLPEGWIDDYVAGRVSNEQSPVVIESDGQRLLVAIADGVSRLSIEEQRAVLALVHGLQRNPDA